MQTIKKSNSLLSKQPTAAIALVASLAAILVVLAILQYYWSGQVSEAEHERMQASLRASMDQFRFQFDREFQQLGFALQPDATTLMQEDWNGYAVTCDRLLGTSQFHLARTVYLWIARNDGSYSLLHLNRQARKFESVPWPAGFEPVLTRYSYFFSAPRRDAQAMRPFGWSVVPQIPIMLQPLIRFQPPSNSSSPGPQFIGFIMLELNLETMRSQLFPELASKYFNGPSGFIYQVAVVRGRNPADVLYVSDPHLTIESFARPDARIRLIDNPPDRVGPGGPRAERPGRPRPMSPFRARLSEPGRTRGMMSMPEPDGVDFELLAKHREGSLEAAVAGSRRRNLAFSFGILLLLAASMALIIVFTRRAQQLAKLQIDFVAGVSHELRTPLAVICSAGDNLADGVVGESGGAARKYGELIRNEGRKLTGMIDQILAFASVGRGRHQYNLRSANINEIADSALNQVQPAIAAAAFSVDRIFDDGLPMVQADPAALSQAIRNLIQNALKFSGESRWLSIRTEKSSSKHGVEVRLTVEDRGMGIDSEDLPHLFEPFYRGSKATSAQIHGTGLGLFMVRESVTSMGGTVSVKSALGKGSAFTIHLPALPDTGRFSSAACEGKPENALQNTFDRG